MRKLKIMEHISLDGVIQHSADDSDFPYSDWTVPYRTPAGRDAILAAYGESYDLLLCPTTIVPPYPIGNRYVAECDGKKFDNYVEWLGIVYAITLACCPALSLPCGFTASGLPIGLQMVAAPRSEGALLAGAKVLEDILGLRGTTPIDPRVAKA